MRLNLNIPKIQKQTQEIYVITLYVCVVSVLHTRCCGCVYVGTVRKVADAIVPTPRYRVISIKTYIILVRRALSFPVNTRGTWRKVNEKKNGDKKPTNTTV